MQSEKARQIPEQRRTPTDAHLFAELDPLWHGDSGPLKKGYSTHLPELHGALVDALESLGVKRNLEPVGHDHSLSAAIGLLTHEDR